MNYIELGLGFNAMIQMCVVNEYISIKKPILIQKH